MDVLPGQLPSWLTPRRLFALAHALGTTSCIVPWTALWLKGAPPFGITGDIVADLGAIAVGGSSTLALVIGTSLLVGRARTPARALLVSVAGTAAAFATASCGVLFHTDTNTEAWNGAIVTEGLVTHVSSRRGARK